MVGAPTLIRLPDKRSDEGSDDMDSTLQIAVPEGEQGPSQAAEKLDVEEVFVTRARL